VAAPGLVKRVSPLDLDDSPPSAISGTGFWGVDTAASAVKSGVRQELGGERVRGRRQRRDVQAGASHEHDALLGGQ
jgi:hypothetical protein